MKLLMYTPVFPPSIGGIESIVHSLASGLAEIATVDRNAEFDITLVTQTPSGGSNDNLLPFPVIRRPSISRLWRLICSSDVIHIAGPALAPLVLGLLAKKPVVVEHHGFQTICPTGQLFLERTSSPCPGHFMAGRHGQCLRCNPRSNWLSACKLWLLTFVRRFLCGHVAANIMPTEWLGGALGLRRAVAIPHGIEMPSHQIAPQLPSASARIVFQGRLVTTKGADLLLKAASILQSANRTFELVLIGDGPERLALEDLASQLQISSCVRFAGRLSACEMEAEFANARMIVMPSLGGEVFGLVLAENMSRGQALIASHLGSFAEVLGDCGLTFRVGDPRDLAYQIERLLDDPELGRRLGVSAQLRIRNIYARQRMVEAHAELYRTVFSTKSHRG